jgi:hypothetical protein
VTAQVHPDFKKLVITTPRLDHCIKTGKAQAKIVKNMYLGF